MLEIIERFINEGERFSKLERVTHKFIHTDMEDLWDICFIIHDKYQLETDQCKLWNLIELFHQLSLYILHIGDRSMNLQLVFKERCEELYPNG